MFLFTSLYTFCVRKGLTIGFPRSKVKGFSPHSGIRIKMAGQYSTVQYSRYGSVLTQAWFRFDSGCDHPLVWDDKKTQFS